MRVCLWHGWLLDGSGSNVNTARVADVLRREGHDVLLVCQERHPERFPFVDAWATADRTGVSPLKTTGVAPAAGRVVLVRPLIGDLLPVFVIDEYEGFARVERFVDLSNAELATYLDRNVTALSAAVEWHGSEALIAGHAVPGPAVARRAVGAGTYVAKIHGSDLVYAIDLQERYAELAREGLEGAISVVGPSDEVLARTVEIVPAIAGRVRKVPPGVEVGRFLPAPRREALEAVSELLAADPETSRGRPGSLDGEVEAVLAQRDGEALEALAHRYDQTVPDPEAAMRLQALASYEGPLVGYFGKLILQKGVERLLEALALIGPDVKGLVVGFGLFREWLEALVAALDRGDTGATRWLAGSSGMRLELDRQIASLAGLRAQMTFTGKLDHRYAPGALAALDVLVVPSTLPEAFGMVVAEGAAAGALPLVARHSGLAEAAGALETAVGRSGLFTFEPGDGATRRLTAGIERILGLPAEERAELRIAVSRFVASEWTWERTANRLMEAARRH